MTYIFCIDEKGGMLFGGKRQSRDRVLIAHLLRAIGDAPLYVTPYSAPLFGAFSSLRVGAHPGTEGFAFVEDGTYDLSAADEVWLCKWNRHYPGDRFFDCRALQENFQKKHEEELAGSSHEKITIEIWRRV